METTLEVLTTRKSGREAHRRWPDDVKAQIVSESLRPGAMVNEVAERHGLKPNHLSTWRTMARQGKCKLLLPAPDDAVEFAAVIVDPLVSEPPTKTVSRPEIIIGSVTIDWKKVRLPPGSPPSPGIKDGLMTLGHGQFEALFAGLNWRRVRSVETRPPDAIE